MSRVLSQAVSDDEAVPPSSSPLLAINDHMITTIPLLIIDTKLPTSILISEPEIQDKKDSHRLF